ncbi:MAG: PilN domain-containing protein [Burkholderiales bacterium]
MKNDINLLYKRRIKTYSGKNIAIALLLIVVIAAGMYAGIAIPSGTISAMKIEAAQLDSHLSSSSETQQDLKDKTQREAVLSLQIAELEAIENSRLDIAKFLSAVEASLPTEANLSSLQFTDEAINLIGTANSDNDISTFCLRLKEQNVFKDVYITNSTSDGQTLGFGITATLPSPLSNIELIKAIEQADITQDAAAAAQQANTTEAAGK